jgi:hypothetical protein
MNRLFRPSIVVAISASLALAAAALLFGPFGAVGAVSGAVPRPVPAGDEEIVWLNTATNAVAWERFVAGIRRLRTDFPELGLEIIPGANPFPAETTQVAELAVAANGGSARLWFRWYKLTGDLSAEQWVTALLARQPPPLAVIGGGSTDRALDLAHQLALHQDQFASPPLMVITSATAIRAGPDQELLMAIYPGRSFRFCFTNRQMAEAVTNFIWSQDDLRPDAPYYAAYWNDDPYSEDLKEQFHTVLDPEGTSRLADGSETAAEISRRWLWGAARLALGGLPPGLDLEGLRHGVERRMPASPFWSAGIPYSVGTLTEANPAEVSAADNLIRGLDQHPDQRRPLLVLPAWPQPGRRFLRALLRTAPAEAGRFVVATGDAIDFNSIYRDRDLTWPIQDLPLPLVCFCHRNPVDAQAFVPDAGTTPPDSMRPGPTGTHDLLLYRDIAEAIIRAAYDGPYLLAEADRVGERLRTLSGAKERGRFDENGDQRSGTGEFVVCLRPVREGDRVLPRARLQVWNWQTNAQGRRRWAAIPVAGAAELIVPYSPATASAGTR